MTKKLLMICALALFFSGVNVLTPANTSEARSNWVRILDIPRAGAHIGGRGAHRHSHQKNGTLCEPGELGCLPVCKEEEPHDSGGCVRRELLIPLDSKPPDDFKFRKPPFDGYNEDFIRKILPPKKPFGE